MANDALKDHYEKKYASESHASGIDTVARVDEPRDRFEAAVKFFPRFFKGGEILELGAGNGSVAKTLLESQSDISGYTLGDISLPRVEGISNNIDDERVSVRLLDAENIPDSEHGKYDAIMMVALIEHLIDPLGAMKNINKLLKPGGFVYIDTPNIAKYTRRIKLMLGYFPSTSALNEGLTTYDGRPSELHDEGHLHYFTYRSLSLMLTDFCNFSHTEKCGYPDYRIPLGRKFHNFLAVSWPEMFSEIALVAFANS